jgi:hypothetical protein
MFIAICRLVAEEGEIWNFRGYGEYFFFELR